MDHNLILLTVTNSLSQLGTTVLGAMMRHVGHLELAGGSSRRSFQAVRSCSRETYLRRRFLSVAIPRLHIMADKKEITWMVFPVVRVYENMTDISISLLLTLEMAMCQRVKMVRFSLTRPMSSPSRPPLPSWYCFQKYLTPSRW